MKLTIAQTGLSHSGWVATTTVRSIREKPPSVLYPHLGESVGVYRRTIGERTWIFIADHAGRIVCSETELVTTVVTSGTSPEIAEIMNDVDPWQWTNALRLCAPVRPRMRRTPAG